MLCVVNVSLYSGLSWWVGQPASEKDWKRGIVQTRDENRQFRGNFSVMVNLRLQVMRMKLFSLSIEVFFIPSWVGIHYVCSSGGTEDVFQQVPVSQDCSLHVSGQRVWVLYNKVWCEWRGQREQAQPKHLGDCSGTLYLPLSMVERSGDSCLGSITQQFISLLCRIWGIDQKRM